jgi:hypothetical protein
MRAASSSHDHAVKVDEIPAPVRKAFSELSQTEARALALRYRIVLINASFTGDGKQIEST